MGIVAALILGMVIGAIMTGILVAVREDDDDQR